MIAIEPHPVTHARLAFNSAASGFTQVVLVAAAAGAADGELMIETDGDNLGASHIVIGRGSGNAIKVPSLRLQRILDDAGVIHVDALKIDVEGYEDRVLTGFFKEAPSSLWPRAVVIEHLSKNEWLADCIADMGSRGYRGAGRPAAIRCWCAAKIFILAGHREATPAHEPSLFRLNWNGALALCFGVFSDANRWPLRLKTLYQRRF